MHLTRIRENHTFLTFVNCSILLPGRTKRGMYCWLQKTWPDSVRSAALIPMRQTRNSASTSTTECSRVQSKQRPTFHLLSSLSMSYSTSTLLVIFGGRLKDIEMILRDERIPEGWEPRLRKRYGLTIAAFNTSVLPLEFQTSGLVKAGEAKTANRDQNQTE